MRFERWLPIACALGGCAFSQQVPTTLTLDHVDATSQLLQSPDVASVDKPSKGTSGNTLIIGVNYIYKGVGGSSKFELTLPVSSFADSNVVAAGLSLTPKGVFQYNFSVTDSRAGLASGAGVLYGGFLGDQVFNTNTCVFIYNVPFPDAAHPPAGPCTLEPVAYDRATKLVNVHGKFYNSVFQVDFDAYYKVQTQSSPSSLSLIPPGNSVTTYANPGSKDQGIIFKLTNSSNRAIHFLAKVVTSGGGDWLDFSSDAASSGTVGAMADTLIPLDLKVGVLVPATDATCRTGYTGQLVVNGDDGSTATSSYVQHVCPSFSVDPLVNLQGLQSPTKPYSTTSNITLINVGISTLDYKITTPTDDGGKWLVLNPSAPSQALPPGGSTTFTVSADLKAIPTSNTKDSPRADPILGFACQDLHGQVLFTASDGGTAASQVTLVLGAARVTKIVGDVTVTHSDNTVTTGPAVSLLQYSDTISTAPNSSVTLLLPDGSKMIVNASTTLAVSQLCTPDGVAQIRTNLQGGSVSTQINRNQPTPPDVGVDTPTATVNSSGDSFDVNYDSEDGTTVSDFGDGSGGGFSNSLENASTPSIKVTPKNPSLQPVTLNAGQQVQVTANAVSPIAAAGTPVSRGTVVNAASFGKPLARGSLATVFGPNLSGTTASASNLPLPKLLGGVQVTVGGIEAPLVYVSPGQINFQIPFEAPAQGTVPVIVKSNGTTVLTINAALSEYAPGVFAYSRIPGYLDPVVVHGATNALVTPDNPSQPDETLVVYATGVGSVTNVPASGAGAPGSPIASSVVTPTATVGSAPAAVLFAGLTPGFVGLIQFNIRLASTLDPASRLPLIVSFNGAQSPPVQLAVKSGIPAPSIRVNPTSVDFGSVVANQSADQNIAITNFGSAPLTVSKAGTDNPLFTVTGSFPLQLGAGAQQTIALHFRPTGTGPQTGTLTIASNDAGSPTVVALSGTGTSSTPTPPKVSLSTSALAFGSVNVGQTKDLSVQVSNSGGTPLLVSSMQVTGASFSLVGPSTLTVPAGQSATVSVHFSPASINTFTGTLTIASNDPSSPAFVSLSGSGVSPSPSITINPKSVDFGAITIGQSSQPKTITLTNTGAASVTVSLITSAPFAVAPASLTVAANGGTGSASVTFTPTSAGASGSNVNILISGQSTPFGTVALTGTGVKATASDVVLQVDGGVFDNAVGFPNGAATAYFVARLTPPSYPATIKSVQLFFSTRDDGLPLNTPLTVISATNPSGSAALSLASAGAIDLTPGKVAALDQFANYTVPSRTITSGDFVVGFLAANPANVYPADLDQLTASKRRAYTSTNGLNFTLLDDASADLAGNLAIRALVTVGSSTNDPASTGVTMNVLK